jgi:hypothetical protein
MHKKLGFTPRKNEFASTKESIKEKTNLNNSDNIFSQLEISPSTYMKMINAEQMVSSFDDIYSSRTDYIYAFSGSANNTALCCCEKYEISKNEWREIKSMPQPRSKYGLCYKYPNVIIFGGKLMDGSRTNAFIQYSTLTDQWENSNMKLPRSESSFGFCLDESKLYICGGSDGNILSSFECIDLTTQKWITLPDMMFKRKDCALVKGPDDNLYVIGGYDGDACLNICERFSIQLFKWEIICPMLVQIRCLACTVMPDGVYVLGGYDGKQYLGHCEKYLLY